MELDLDLVFLALPAVWTVLCAIGLGMANSAVMTAWGDLSRQRKSGINGAIRIIRRKAIDVYVLLIFVMVGILAMLGPYGLTVVPAIASRAFSTFGFISIAVALVVDEVLDQRERQQVLDYANKMKQAEG